MTSPRVKSYLDQLHARLGKLPEADRLDAVREIESHIAEGIANGQLEMAILSRLGEPDKLAKAYRSEYMMGRRSLRSAKDVLAMVGFYCTAGLMSVVVVPTLATIAYGFGFCSVLIFAAGILRTLGVTWISMGFGPGREVPVPWSMAVAVPVAAIVGGIAYVCWRNLKKYLAFLSDRYRAVLPGSRA